MLMRRFTPTCRYKISIRCLANDRKVLYHPVTALISPVRHDINVDCTSRLVVTCLDGAGELHHVLNGIGLEKVFIVEVVEEEV
jgi:hypothetical protein